MFNYVNSIVIVGGGSAGWAVASTLINDHPNMNISVVESKSISTVGVGESTSREINFWLKKLNVETKDFIKNVDGNYKIATKYSNFSPKNNHFFYSYFGNEEEINYLTNNNLWLYKKYFYPEIDHHDYFEKYIYQCNLLKNNKFLDKEYEDFFPFKIPNDVGIQFDAKKFANYFSEKYAIPKGVKRIYGTVKNIIKNENGIEKIILEDGLEINSDFFIDCTGFKSLFLNFLNQKFISTKDILPNNKAYYCPVQYTDKEKELEGFTHSVALNNGHAWNTPLWSRIGTGYVYSDEFTDEDSALKEFHNFLDSDKMAVYDPNRSKKVDINKLYIKNGYYENCWVKNVCAIGLSAGFIDPMESSGIWFVTHYAEYISNIFKKKYFTNTDKDELNSMYSSDIIWVASLIKLHFVLSNRKDTEYWKKISNDFSENVVSKTIKNNPYLNKLSSALQSKLIGMDSSLINNYELINKNNINEDFFKFLHLNFDKQEISYKKVIKLIEKLPTQYEYLKNNIFYDCEKNEK